MEVQRSRDSVYDQIEFEVQCYSGRGQDLQTYSMFSEVDQSNNVAILF